MSDRYPQFPPEAVSVTEMLLAVGLIDTTWFNDHAARRGTQVHLACRYLAEGRLDWATVDPQIEPYVKSYEKFLELSHREVKSVEESGYHEKLKYCGTWDVVFDYLADLKTGAYQPWHRAQLGAYYLLYIKDKQTYGTCKRLATIYLQADGSIAKAKFHPAYICETEFMTALNFYRLKEQYGLK